MAPEAKEQFKKWSAEHKYDPAKHVLPHGSYLVNLAQPDPDKAEQAYTCFLDDLQRCEALGIKLYNFHPGSSGKNPRPEAIARIAKQLNKAHKATSTVITVRLHFHQILPCHNELNSSGMSLYRLSSMISFCTTSEESWL